MNDVDANRERGDGESGKRSIYFGPSPFDLFFLGTILMATAVGLLGWAVQSLRIWLR